MMRYAIQAVLGGVACIVVAVIIVWWFFGKTDITASLDGEPLDGAIVEINGDVVGETPYTKRLGPGFHRVLVMPPEGKKTVESNHNIRIFTMMRGVEYQADFHKRDEFVNIEVEIKAATTIVSISSDLTPQGKDGWMNEDVGKNSYTIARKVHRGTHRLNADLGNSLLCEFRCSNKTCDKEPSLNGDLHVRGVDTSDKLKVSCRRDPEAGPNATNVFIEGI